MLELSKFKKVIILLVYDLVATVLAGFLSYLIAVEGGSILLTKFVNYLPIMAINFVCTVILFALTGMYDIVWRFAGFIEAIKLVLTTLCVFAIDIILFYVIPNPIYSQTVRNYTLRWAFGFFFVFLSFAGFGRFFWRLWLYFKASLKPEEKKLAKRIMVIGAGMAGSKIIEEINDSDKIKDRCVVCVIDDNKAKLGQLLHGIKIVGNRNDIPDCAEKYKIDEIIIALPSAKRSEVRDVIGICQKTKCKVKTLPGVYQLINGQASVSSIRNVEIQDLLGREQVVTNIEEVIGYIKDNVVLVTGGGGSIGSELCRQIASHSPKQLIIVDIYENNAYDIQQELLRKYSNLNLLVLIASVRDSKKINDIFKKYKPDIVFHAAAHKHVPLMETSPNEAIKNNVSGTLKVARAADANGTKRFVLISTDKAVNPTNIMGASKRICEMIIQTMAKHSKTQFVAVRFGNVLGSNGSVIPLFKKQIEEGGPVTVTDERITRYFMTIPEAVSLILQAGAYANGGEIFVLDMGEPVKIYDLAENLIRLSGFEPNVDIEIKITGLRPGEKLYEERLMEEEGLQKTANDMISIGKPLQIDEENLMKKLDELYVEAYNETDRMKLLVKELVPTYIPDLKDSKKD